MTDKTEKELTPHLEALNMVYYQSSDGPMIKPRSRDKHDCTCSIKLEELGINLVPEQPEITQANLSRFCIMFKDDECCFPTVEYKAFSNQDYFTEGTLFAVCVDGFITDQETCMEEVVMKDPRWAELGEGDE